MEPRAVRDMQSFPCVPPKVAAAQDFLNFGERLRNPGASFDGARPDGRDLVPREQAVYDAALEVLRSYFTGEQEHVPGASSLPPLNDDDPESRVPVAT